MSLRRLLSSAIDLRLMLIGAAAFFPQQGLPDVLLNAPSDGAYYGMYCNDPCLAASFTLSGTYYVSTIDIVLHTPATTSFTTFNFSLQDSLTSAAIIFARSALTVPLGVSTAALNVNKTLPPGTYYLVGGVPGYLGSNGTAGDVVGWLVSTGVYTGTAGTITNGVWGSGNSQWSLSQLSSYIAPAFTVNGGGGQPSVTLDPPAAGASHLSGHAYNIDPSTTKVVIYALTNQWYVQPLTNAPFTNISSDGSWSNSTNPWSKLVILLVNPTNYTPMATEISNPALDPGVLAYTMYPPGPASVSFSGYTWGIKMTGNSPGNQFDPGPNFWSNDSSVVNVAEDGLHLKINRINGMWQCGEIYLTKSLGYGTYTVQVSSHLDQLNQNTVAAPLFIYAAPGQELDNEYSGLGGLIPNPYNAQFVVQPFTVPGNIIRYKQPATAQFTSQIVWTPDHVTFSSWNGWSSTPAPSDIISRWTYTGRNNLRPGQERVRMNLWLQNGNSTSVSSAGDEMVIHSLAFESAPLQFIPVTPCRVADTRNPVGAFGGPALFSQSTRDFTIPASACHIPSSAQAYALNITVVPSGPLHWITAWPSGQPQPIASTLNSYDGGIKANAAIIPAGANGAISVFATENTHVVLDITGYFVAAPNASALAFYPLTPCRIADTRAASGPLGGPSMSANQTRQFPVLSSSCNIPTSAHAYSLNITVVPKGPLAWLTAWPAGQNYPGISALNAPSGTVVANAALVPAGSNGNVSIFVTNNTDVILDINGYFAPPATGGLSLHTLTPCRVFDTRSNGAPLTGTIAVDIISSSCNVPAASAYVFNATVIPSATLKWLTLWPYGDPQPEASILNAYAGMVTSNMAILPATNGSINAYTTDPAHLILDISGLFAP